MKTKNNIMRNIIGILLVSSSFIHSQNVDPYQFFPTNIGDRWEYTQAGPDIIYTVLRDSVDTKDSSRFVFFYDPPLYYGANYRIDKNYNIFYLPQFDNLHEYKLDAHVGEKWIVFVSNPNKWEESKVSGIYENFVFGKLTTIKEIQHYQCWRRPDSLIDTTLIDVQKLAYGFGLISKENYVLQPYLLRGCRINGVTYGTVDVEEEPNIIPSEYILYQNYPNPFNPSTTISFSIPNYSRVVVKVFDILGREIQEIVNDYFYPGKHSVKFNANNLTSGVYLYQIVTNKTTRTLKMILQK